MVCCLCDRFKLAIMNQYTGGLEPAQTTAVWYHHPFLEVRTWITGVLQAIVQQLLDTWNILQTARFVSLLTLFHRFIISAISDLPFGPRSEMPL